MKQTNPEIYNATIPADMATALSAAVAKLKTEKQRQALYSLFAAVHYCNAQQIDTRFYAPIDSQDLAAHYDRYPTIIDLLDRYHVININKKFAGVGSRRNKQSFSMGYRPAYHRFSGPSTTLSITLLRPLPDAVVSIPVDESATAPDLPRSTAEGILDAFREKSTNGIYYPHGSLTLADCQKIAEESGLRIDNLGRILYGFTRVGIVVSKLSKAYERGEINGDDLNSIFMLSTASHLQISHGRIYSFFHHLPKAFRKYTTHPTEAFDVHASNLQIVAKVLSNNPEIDKEELDSFTTVLRTGDIYLHLADGAKDVTRDAIKEQVQAFVNADKRQKQCRINFAKSHPRDIAYFTIGATLEKNYPSIAKALSDWRKVTNSKGKTVSAIYDDFVAVETPIISQILSILHNRGIDAVSIHDAVFVPEGVAVDSEELRNLFFDLLDGKSTPSATSATIPESVAPAPEAVAETVPEVKPKFNSWADLAAHFGRSANSATSAKSPKIRSKFAGVDDFLAGDSVDSVEKEEKEEKEDWRIGYRLAGIF